MDVWVYKHLVVIEGLSENTNMESKGQGEISQYKSLWFEGFSKAI